MSLKVCLILLIWLAWKIEIGVVYRNIQNIQTGAHFIKVLRVRDVSRIFSKGVLKIRFPGFFHKFSPVYARFIVVISSFIDRYVWPISEIHKTSGPGKLDIKVFHSYKILIILKTSKKNKNIPGFQNPKFFSWFL